MTITRTLERFAQVRPSSDPVVEQLARESVETITGATTATLTLSNPPAFIVAVTLNGVRLAPSDYTVSGKTLTLPRALVAGDVVAVHSKFKPA